MGKLVINSSYSKLIQAPTLFDMLSYVLSVILPFAVFM